MSKYKEHPSKERLDELLRYEPDTGKLYWRVDRRGTVKAGLEAGRILDSEYRQIGIDGSYYRAHNLVWIMCGKELPLHPNTLDHRDKNKLNNRITNIREATPRQQGLNKLVRGFNRHQSKWQAHSEVLPNKYIGTYPTALQARLAYEKATSEVEPEFASTFFTDAFNELIASPS